jgi:hypothetical protein
VDDLFLRMLGLSVPPFDMIWLLETITDYADEGRWKENQRRINNELRQNRLQYELDEINKAEYDEKNTELNRQRFMNRRMNRATLSQRINILG